MARLERRTDSWLSDARATDVEMYRAARDAGKLGKATRKTEIVEWGTTQQLLSTLILLMQQLIHAVYVHHTPSAKKKPKLNPWPGPKTAEQMVHAQDVRDTYKHLEENIIRSVPTAEYEAMVGQALREAESVAMDAASAASDEGATTAVIPANVDFEELRRRARQED